MPFTEFCCRSGGDNRNAPLLLAALDTPPPACASTCRAARLAGLDVLQPVVEGLLLVTPPPGAGAVPGRRRVAAAGGAACSLLPTVVDDSSAIRRGGSRSSRNRDLARRGT